MDRGEGKRGDGKGGGEEEDDDEGGRRRFWVRARGPGRAGTSRRERPGRVAFPGMGMGTETKTGTEAGVGESAPAPWHKDECVRLATFSQVWCAFAVITGAELTPTGWRHRAKTGVSGSPPWTSARSVPSWAS